MDTRSDPVAGVDSIRRLRSKKKFDLRGEAASVSHFAKNFQVCKPTSFQVLLEEKERAKNQKPESH